jgi:hypothetical protein
MCKLMTVTMMLAVLGFSVPAGSSVVTTVSGCGDGCTCASCDGSECAEDCTCDCSEDCVCGEDCQCECDGSGTAGKECGDDSSCSPAGCAGAGSLCVPPTAVTSPCGGSCGS